MYSNLNAMLATAQRDELLRNASRHNQARQSRRDVSSNSHRFVASVLSFRFGGRRNAMRPAVAT